VRIAVRLLGTEVLAVELHRPDRRPAPPPPCRFAPPERARLEAGGIPHLDFGFTRPDREPLNPH
jgi:hypothetical protein